MEEVRAIEKILSSNDLGINGSHQSGMLIPKGGNILSFFPLLDPDKENPRVPLYFLDDMGEKWKFHYIYYNNKFRGGTRNEYRLTGMTAFFRSANLKVGDSIIYKRNGDEYLIFYKRHDSQEVTVNNGIVRLVLNNEWKVIDF